MKNKGRTKSFPRKKIEVVAADVFCGVGGLTRGLEKSGIKVKVGVDIDPACEYPYVANNDAKFILKSVRDVEASELGITKTELGEYRLLAGCAPCQPFSSYQQKLDSSDSRWNLLDDFARLAEEVDPDFITMENVPNLAKQQIFLRFVAKLERLKYNVSHEIIDCSEFGVPQQRQRLVLLASKLGPISLIKPNRIQRPKTVREAIGSLPRLQAGGVDKKDRLHQASRLSELNLKRIKASVPGGTWRDWDRELVADCHLKASGKTYPGVYGRMAWDAPAPTMTTQFFGFGNGRFGHPSQARAISIREGAILQSFPKSYKFVRPDEPVRIKVIGRLVGNAVPVKLGEAIGKSILKHAQLYDPS